MSSSPTPLGRDIEAVQWSRGRQAVPGEAYTYGSWRGIFDCLRPRRGVADAFDAMTTNRVYKPRRSVADAIEEIRKKSGSQFDPQIAEAACEALAGIDDIHGTGQLPANELEEARFAYFFKDQLTGLYNKSYLKLKLIENERSLQYRALNVIFLKNFTDYNTRTSWEEGDQLLVEFAQWLERAFPDALKCRVFGDDFAILSREPLRIDDDAITQNEVLRKAGIEADRRYYDLHTIPYNLMLAWLKSEALLMVHG
jgi:GGDEF domain-containing protein